MLSSKEVETITVNSFKAKIDKVYENGTYRTKKRSREIAKLPTNWRINFINITVTKSILVLIRQLVNVINLTSLLKFDFQVT